MSAPDEDQSNPFLKPSTVRANLFGGSVPSSGSINNTTTMFGNTAARAGSSLFGGTPPVSSSSVTATSAVTNPTTTEAVSGTAVIFGGISSGAPSATSVASSTLFGGQSSSLFSKPSNTLPPAASTGAPVSTTSLFGGVPNLGAHTKHSLFGGLDQKQSSKAASSPQNLFNVADKSQSSAKNIHSLFGSSETENITSKQFGSLGRSNQQEPKVSSSRETQSSFSSLGSVASLFGGNDPGSNRSNLFGTSKTVAVVTDKSKGTDVLPSFLNKQPASSTPSQRPQTFKQLDQQPVPKIVSLFGSDKVSSSNNRNPFGDSRSSSRGPYVDPTSRPHLFPRNSATSDSNQYSAVASTARRAESTWTKESSAPVFASQSVTTSNTVSSKQSTSSGATPLDDKKRISTPVDTRPITSYDDIFGLSNESSMPKATEGKKSPIFSEKVEPTAIIALNVPNNFLDKKILKNHFSKFGTVDRVSLHATANQAQINYTNHESAAMAKKLGKVLHPNLPPLMIFFATAARTRPDDNQDNQARHKRNNAVKFLRQSSSDSQEKLRKLTRKPSRESLKSSRPKIDPEKATPKLEHTSSLKLKSHSSSQSRVVKRSSEESKPTPAEIPKPAAVVSAKDFVALRQVKALHSQDRYNLLDSRDKLVRKVQTKEVDVRRAQYLSATCPDMCPEKERYMREVQYDLSPYEMTSDRKVDHQRAVKKFSRSSADKDEPLPHELRAGPVLVMTMNYLVCNVLNEMEDGTTTDMDLCYNYLWDRTRAMRSDIMQQHLLDSSAVYVFERCVRFHVFCSERLCLEPPDVFDPKMNVEHLSKSMHSLKEIYSDMAENGVYFETEAEFRAYDILLNVDDGDIMFAYLLFREPVRKSREVQFAISILHAIQSNNYVRFFRLVSEATFLQACILHRYFTRVRSQALSILVKAFHVPGKSQSISLAKLTRLLSFEGVTEVANFLAHHGLSVGANSRIVMDRASFITHPEEAIPVYRSFHVVGIKKEVSVSEAIHGGPLPPNPLDSHQVHNSFSPDGFLESKATTASDQGPATGARAVNVEASVSAAVSNVRQPSVPDLVHPTPLALASRVSSPDEGLEDDNEELYEPSEEETYNDHVEGLEQFQEKMQHKLLGKCFAEWRSVVYQSIELQNAVDCLKQSAQQELIDEWRVRTALKSRTESVLQLVEFKLKEKYFSCWKDNCVRAKKLKLIRRRILSRHVLRKWLQFVKAKKTSRYYQKIRCIVQKKLYLMRLRRFAQKWRRSARVSKVVSLLENKRRTSLMRKYFDLWCKYVKEKEWQKKKMYEGFPSGTCRLSLHEQNLAWKFNCGNLKRSFRDVYAFEEDAEVKRKKLEMVEKLSEQICKAPLPVCPSFQRFINSKSVPKSCKHKFFTLVVCFEENIDPFVTNWIRLKLNPSQNAQPVQINCSYNIKSSLSDDNHVIQIIESKKELLRRIKGVSSVLYVTGTAKSNEAIKIPVDTAVSSKIFFLNRKVCLTPNTSSNLMNAILELYKKSSPALNLKACTLNQLVTSFVSKHVLEIASDTERLRKEMNYAPLPPAAYSSLLHRAIDHLRSALLSDRVAGLEWHTPQSTADKPQLCKMSAKLCDIVKQALDQCSLPPFHLKRCDTWTAAFEGIREYIEHAFDAADPAKLGLVEDITWQIEQAKKFMIKQKIVPAGEDSLPDVLLLPWKDIYCALIARRLIKVPAVDVVCCVDDLENYACNNDWFQPYWQPASAVSALQPRHKRKALHNIESQKVQNRTKRVKPESDVLKQLAEEKKKSIAFQNHLEDLLDSYDNPLVKLFEEQGDNHQVPTSNAKPPSPDTEELYDMSEPTLLDKLIKEKNKQLAFEERLRQMLC